MKKSFIELHSELKTSVMLAIQLAVSKSKTKSKHISENVIHINDDKLSYNMSGSHWLTEIAEGKMLCNDGYHFSYDVLDLEQLCELADYCNNLKAMALIKGTLTTEWDNGESIVTVATLDLETGEVVRESVEVDESFEILDREYFTGQENNEYDICPECHEYVLKYSIDGETCLQEKKECPSCGYCE